MDRITRAEGHAVTGTVGTANPPRRPAAATCAFSVREAGASVFCHSLLARWTRSAGPRASRWCTTCEPRSTIGHVTRNDPPKAHSVPRPGPIEALATGANLGI